MPKSLIFLIHSIQLLLEPVDLRILPFNLLIFIAIRAPCFNLFWWHFHAFEIFAEFFKFIISEQLLVQLGFQFLVGKLILSRLCICIKIWRLDLGWPGLARRSFTLQISNHLILLLHCEFESSVGRSQLQHFLSDVLQVFELFKILWLYYFLYNGLFLLFNVLSELVGKTFSLL